MQNKSHVILFGTTSIRIGSELHQPNTHKHKNEIRSEFEAKNKDNTQSHRIFVSFTPVAAITFNATNASIGVPNVAQSTIQHIHHSRNRPIRVNHDGDNYSIYRNCVRRRIRSTVIHKQTHIIYPGRRIVAIII